MHSSDGHRLEDSCLDLAGGLRGMNVPCSGRAGLCTPNSLGQPPWAPQWLMDHVPGHPLRALASGHTGHTAMFSSKSQTSACAWGGERGTHTAKKMCLVGGALTAPWEQAMVSGKDTELRSLGTSDVGGSGREVWGDSGPGEQQDAVRGRPREIAGAKAEKCPVGLLGDEHAKESSFQVGN